MKHPIDDVVEWILSMADRTIKEDTVRNATHWFFAVLASRKSKIIKKGMEDIPLNYFALPLSGSGSGKGFILGKLLSLINQKDYESFIGYYIQNRPGPKTEINDKYLAMFNSVSEESTTQGIHKLAETIQSTYPAGSLNFMNSEFFSTASRPIMRQLLDGYDGAFQKPNIKGADDKEEYRNVEGIVVNLIGFSSIKPLLHNDNAFKSFTELMDTGWFRRAWLTTDRDHVIRSKEPVEYRLQDSTIEYINSGSITEEKFNSEDIVLTINDVADQLRKDLHNEFIDTMYEFEHNQYRDANKVLRLAGIRAVSDGRSIIEEYDMQYAIEFERRCHNDATSLLLLQNKFVRAYELMKQQQITMMDLKRLNVIPDSMSRKAFDDLIADIEEYAIAKDSVLEQKDNSFHIRSLRAGSVSSVTIGVGENRYSMFKPVMGPFGEDLMKYMNGQNITPWIFEDTILNPDMEKTNRTKENAIESHMVCFDFEMQTDKNTGEVFELTINDVEDIFEEYEYILRTSSSHLKEGKGHRFHIYIPYKYIMTLDSETYRDTYLSIAKKFGIFDFIDRSTSHRASYFKEAQEPKYMKHNDGIKLDYRCCIPNTTQSETIESSYQNVQSAEFKNYRLKMYISKVLNDLNVGNRDNTINAAVYAMKTKIGADKEDMKRALDILRDAVEFDSSFRAKDFDKFYKRI